MPQNALSDQGQHCLSLFTHINNRKQNKLVQISDKYGKKVRCPTTEDKYGKRYMFLLFLHLNMIIPCPAE